MIKHDPWCETHKDYDGNYCNCKLKNRQDIVTPLETEHSSWCNTRTNHGGNYCNCMLNKHQLSDSKCQCVEIMKSVAKDIVCEISFNDEYNSKTWDSYRDGKINEIIAIYNRNKAKLESEIRKG